MKPRAVGGRRGRRDAGVVLIVVLFFLVLLTSNVSTFISRAAVDSMIARNREAAARAEALARGGVRLAGALLVEDALREATELVPMETASDPWALMAATEIDTGDGASLRLRIDDAGTRLNLNALPMGEGAGPPEETLLLVRALLEKVIEELPLSPAERALYDAEALADHLIDWLDPDDVAARGGPEDAYYQEQDPPYRAANRPLFSLEELRMIQGFDGPLVAGLRGYVTVHPWAPEPGKGGINPNTAPAHVLALIFYFDGVTYRFVDEDQVRRILKLRDEGRLVCQEPSLDVCTPMSEIVGVNPVFPEPAYSSSVFHVTAEGRVGSVRRTVEAIVDRSDGPPARLLSWRVR